LARRERERLEQLEQVRRRIAGRGRRLPQSRDIRAYMSGLDKPLDPADEARWKAYLDWSAWALAQADRIPGPFAFKDPAYLRDIFESAGFDKAGFDAWSGDLPFAGPGASCADAVTFALEGMAFRDRAAALDPRARDALARDLVDFYKGHATAQGLMMPARVWLAQATA